jgi:hypothetical protein
LDSLFTTESGNRNIEFYDILYKRYAKEIKQGIEDNFTVIKPDGSKKVLTEKERMDNFLTKVSQNPDIPYTIEELNKLVDEKKVIVNFVEGVPNIKFDSRTLPEVDFGGELVGDFISNKFFGIIKVDYESNNTKSGKITIDEQSKNDYKHEWIHVSNMLLKEKYKLTESDPYKEQMLWSFIDEFMAYGTNLVFEEDTHSAQAICVKMLYRDWNPKTIEGLKLINISKSWETVMAKSVKDKSGLYRNKIKAYLINHAKNFDDIDLTIPATKAKFEKATL